MAETKSTKTTAKTSTTRKSTSNCTKDDLVKMNQDLQESNAKLQKQIQEMMENMKILMVCGNGLGSSFACQMTVETVLQELGVSASLDHCDLSSVKGMKADLILSGKNFESQFANLELTTPTIFLNRLVDKNEIREKIVPFLKEQGKL